MKAPQRHAEMQAKQYKESIYNEEPRQTKVTI